MIIVLIKYNSFKFFHIFSNLNTQVGLVKRVETAYIYLAEQFELKTAADCSALDRNILSVGMTGRADKPLLLFGYHNLLYVTVD